MSYGKVEYDINGNPICEICGKAYSRVLSHVRQVHDLSAKDYKLKFGLDLNKGICSKKSADKTRKQTMSNYESVIKNNLLIKGKKTQFKVGHNGRTKDKVSEQTLIRLKSNFDKQ